MKSYKKYLIGLLAALSIPAIVYALNITVPAAPSAGYWLNSTSTGAYVSVPSSTLTYFYPLTGNPSAFISLTGLSATAPIVYNSSTGGFSWINSDNYISTSTALTTANFATTSISQWNNDSGYITTSTNNFGGLTNTSITATAPLTWSTGSVIGLTYPLAATYGGTATTTALGSAAFHPSTDFLASSTTYVASNIAGTGIGVSGATGNVTISNTGVTSFNGSTGVVTGVGSFNGATGTVTVALPSIATTTKTIYDIAPATTDYPSFLINSPATTTIKEVDCFNDNSVGSTFTFNIVVSSTVTTGLTYASSSLLFAANQTCTATSTASVLTSFANATIGKGQTAWLWFPTAPSSTAAHVQINF